MASQPGLSPWRGPEVGAAGSGSGCCLSWDFPLWVSSRVSKGILGGPRYGCKWRRVTGTRLECQPTSSTNLGAVHTACAVGTSPFIYLFNNDVLSARCVPSTVLNTEDTAMGTD